MESQFYTEVSNALQESSNPDPQVMQQAQSFFFKQHLNNIQMYNILFQISANANAQNNLNLKAVIILKKIADLYFSKLDQKIQNLYVNYILTESIKQKNHQILQIQMQILKKTLQIFEKEQDQNLFVSKIKQLFTEGDFDAEKYYALLLMVQVFISEHQHASNSDRKILDTFIEQIFPFLNNLLSQLQSAENVTILAMYSHILAKLFFKAFRYQPSSLILLPEYYNNWFNFFSSTLKIQQQEFLKAKKWIIRSLLVFYRNFKNNKDKNNLQDNFWVDWKNTFADTFFVQLLENVFYLKNTNQYNKISCNISRAFLFYIDENVINKHQDKIFQIIQQKIFQLSEYNQLQKDQFYDNPVEFLKQNIWKFSDDDVRDSVSFMLQIFYRNGMSKQILQLLSEKLKSGQQLETNIFLIQKIYKEIHESLNSTERIQFFQELASNIILPNLDSSDDFIKMRCCAIIEFIHTEIQDQNLIKQIVEKICQCLQDKQMVVKSFASISLGALINLAFVKEMMQNHLQTLLQIYISLIKQCDNEQLIASFGKIIYQYQNYLGTYAVDLVQQFLEILINLFEQSSDNIDDIENKYFSQLETFQAIKLLFKTEFNDEQIIKTFNMLDIVFLKLIQNGLINQGIESMIEIFEELLLKKNQGQLYKPFWKYFEFICRTIIEPPNKNQYQNNLFQHINKIEQEIDATNFLRLYVYQDKQTLVTCQDEFGINYLDLLIQCVNKLDKVLTDPSLGMIAPIKVFKSDLIWLLKDINHNSVQNFIGLTLQENVKAVQTQLKQDVDILEQQINWRNLGISLYFYPEQTFNLLQVNSNQEFAKIWRECQYHLMTTTMRIGSFLGLLQYLKICNFDIIQNFELMKFMVMEILFIDHVKQYETVIDLDILNDDNDDIGENCVKPQQLNTLQDIKNLLKYFEDNFIMECEELCINTEDRKCFLENQNLKQMILQIQPNFLENENFKNIYNSLEPELKTRIEKIFANQLNQQNVQINQGCIRIRF